MGMGTFLVLFLYPLPVGTKAWVRQWWVHYTHNLQVQNTHYDGHIKPMTWAMLT